MSVPLSPGGMTGTYPGVALSRDLTWAIAVGLGAARTAISDSFFNFFFDLQRGLEKLTPVPVLCLSRSLLQALGRVSAACWWEGVGAAGRLTPKMGSEGRRTPVLAGVRSTGRACVQNGSHCRLRSGFLQYEHLAFA